MSQPGLSDNSQPLQAPGAEANRVDKQKARHALALYAGFGAAAIVFLILFSPVFKVGLLSDDWGLSVGYSIPWNSFSGSWFGGSTGGFYRPLSRIAIFVQGRVFGFSGVGQHALSCLLALGAAFFLCLGLSRAHGVGAALAASLFFLVNPNITEVVAWVSSQTDLLVGFFYVGALYFLIPPVTAKRAAFSLLFAIPAYLSKDSSITLGPTVIAAAAYLLVARAVTEPRQRRLAIGIAAAHGLLWAAYLIARRVLLGRIGMESPGFAPAHGWAQHWALNLLTVLQNTFQPYFNWSGERDFLVQRGAPLWWLPLAGAAVFGWLARCRRHDLAVLALAWLVALLPAITLKIPWFYQTLTGSSRFLYLSLPPLCAMVGIVFQELWLELRAPARTAVVAVAAVFGSHVALETSRGLDDWVRCASVRDRLEQELRRVCKPASESTIVIESLPDHVGEGYVFRSGFAEFFQWKIGAGNAALIDAKKFCLADIKPAADIFRLNYAGEAAPMISPAADLKRLALELPQRRQRPAPANLFLDFTRGGPLPIPLSKSDDVLSMTLVPGALLAEVRPLDPYFIIGFGPEVDPAVFRRALFEFELLDATPGAGGNDKVELIWKPLGMETNLPALSAPFKLAPGVQTIEFQLDGNVQWLAPRQLQWARFDLGGFYRGRAKITRMGFLP